MSCTKHLFVTALLVLLFGSHGFAGLVAYDDVNAPTGQLHAVSTGWNMGSWDVQNGNTDTYAVYAPGLVHGALAVGGNTASGGGVYLSSGIGLAIPATWEPSNEWVPYRYNGYYAGADGTTLWASMLFSQWSENNWLGLNFHDSGIRWLDGNLAVKVAIDGSGNFVLEDKNGDSVSTGTYREAGHNYLLVFKMDFIDATSDRVTLYIDPTPGIASPDVAGTVLDTNDDFYFRSIQFNPGQNKYEGFLDEIRFGDTYSDVTPAGAVTNGFGSEPFRVYFIGNSVTDNINYEGLRQMAVGTGKVHLYGRHMIPGSPLDNLWNSPTSGFTAAPYDYYPTALPGWDWNAVSFQPFDRDLASDVNHISRFIDVALTNPENANTDYLIYARWPRTSQTGWYDDYWLSDYTGGYGEEEKADFFETLTVSMRAEYPNLSIRMVPVGHVMYELNQKFKAGQVPGFTHIQDVYADGVHMNNYGEYIAGCTYYAMLYKENPTGLPSSTYGFEDPVYAQAVQQTVWDVVTSHPLTGIGREGDFEPDGDVDTDDLDYLAGWWLNDCNETNDNCDGTDLIEDGTVKFNDFSVMANNWAAEPYSP